MPNDPLDKLKNLASASSKKQVKDSSGAWIKVASTVVTLFIPIASILLFQAMGELRSGMQSLGTQVREIEQIDGIKERLVRLESADRIISHAQLSSSRSQYPPKNGSLLEMDLVDSIEGSLEFDPRRDPTSIRILEDGSYLLLIVPQVRRIANFTGEGCLTTWLVVNNKDLANSSIKNCIVSENWRETMTTTLQAILPMHEGETIQIKMRSQPDGQVGMVAIAPEGAPLVPAVITSLVRVGS